MKENIIEKKSFDFAVEIVATYKYLTFEKKNSFSQNNFYDPAHQLEQILQKPLADNHQKILFINSKSQEKRLMKPFIG